MVKLGVSGFLMVIAEFLAFEILTLASSYLSNTALAAQAALASLSIVTFQIPFPISIAGSTRLANLIGAGLPGAAKICIQVTVMLAFAAGLLNMILLTSLRDCIPRLFTDDMEVRLAIVSVLPIFAGFQLFDAGVASVNGLMRGMGRQGLGSWVNMCCYYLVSILPLVLTYISDSEDARSRYPSRSASRSDFNGVSLDCGWVHPLDFFCMRKFSFPNPSIFVHILIPHLTFLSFPFRLLLMHDLQCHHDRRLAHLQHELGPRHRSRIASKRICLSGILLPQLLDLKANLLLREGGFTGKHSSDATDCH